MATLSVGQCRRRMCRLGYRVQDSASRPSVGPECWQAEATRDGRVIRAWAPTRAAAWELVCQMAGTVERESGEAGDETHAGRDNALATEPAAETGEKSATRAERCA